MCSATYGSYYPCLYFIYIDLTKAFNSRPNSFYNQEGELQRGLRKVIICFICSQGYINDNKTLKSLKRCNFTSIIKHFNSFLEIKDNQYVFKPD